MKSSQIVHGGGWVKRQSVAKPRTRLFILLSLIWFGVSIAASAPFWLKDGRLPWSGYEWLSLLVILPELVFIGLASYFALTEKPRPIVVLIPNPGHDLRKLYWGSCLPAAVYQV
jgi:hypothetical protein